MTNLHIGFQSLLDSPLDAPGWVQLVVEVQGLDSRPDIRRDGAAELSYQGQLVLLRVALHDGGARPHLGHDTAGSPHVHRRAVVPLAEQQLRGSVPEGHHPVGVSVGLAGFVDGDGAGQTKVSELQDPLLGDENVGCLHVPVDDLVGVDVEESLTHLLHHFLYLSGAELDVDVAEKASEIVFTEIKDQEECCLVTTILTADLQQVHDVLMVQQLEDSHLSQGRDGEALLLVLHQNFLEGDYLSPVCPTSGFEDLPECSLSNLGNLLILVYPGAVGKVELLNVSVLILGHLGSGVRGRLVVAGPRGP